MAIRAPDGANKKPDDFPTSDFEILPAEGDLKSGIPALTEMPAPHMITMFLNFPSSNPCSRAASENPEVFDDRAPITVLLFFKDQLECKMDFLSRSWK